MSSNQRRIFSEKNEKDPLFDDEDYSEEEDEFTRSTGGTFQRFTRKSSSNMLSMSEL
jgi:hypothetical protein